MKNKQTVYNPVIFTPEVLAMFDNTPQCRFLHVDDTLPIKEVEKLLAIQLQLIQYRRDLRRAKDFAKTKVCTFLPTTQISDPYEKVVYRDEWADGAILERTAIGYINFAATTPKCIGPDCMHFDMQTFSCKRTG